MRHMIQILSRTIIVCVLVVLSLVLVLWLRVSIHEIGVLLSIGKSKMEIIVTFLAILELMKVGKISIYQENAFDDIEIESKLAA